MKKREQHNKLEKRSQEHNKEYRKKKREKFKHKTKTMPAPKDFRIVSNTSEVLKYFKSIIDIIRKNRNNIKIYFDLSKVELISVDTVMYMLAILRNLKENIYRNITFAGNHPTNKEANKIFVESGFLNYVNRNNKHIKPNSNKIQIRAGKTADSTIAKDICIVVNDTFGTSKIFTLDLYPVLVELMTNTVQHAYSKESVFLVNEWYLFAEENGDEIQFVFLDTGEGIPATVDKRIREKVRDFVLSDKDSVYIQTALEGKHRTQTRQFNRGEGLPRVVAACTGGNLSDLTVHSGKGSCKILNGEEKVFRCTDYDEQLYGTLYMWKLKKPVLEVYSDEYNNCG